MDIKRMTVFFAVSLLILLGWEKIFPTPQPAVSAVQQAGQQQATPTIPAKTGLSPAVPITVSTDTVNAVIDEKSGDLRSLTLLKYDSAEDQSKPFTLFHDGKDSIYVAQSDVVDAAGRSLTQGLSFQSAQKQYSLEGDKAEVRLTANTANGIQIDKIYTFTKGSYLVGIRFDVTNRSGSPIRTDGSYRIVRDGKAPEGQGYFMANYTGPVLYTPQGEFQKVSFGDLDDDFKEGREQAEYERKTQSGWVGMSQHYFFSSWILQPKDGQSVCATDACRIDIKRRSDNLYSAGVIVPQPELANGMKQSFGISLYAGPQTTSALGKIADHLELIKDYGRVHWPLLADGQTARLYRQLGLGNRPADYYRQNSPLPAEQRRL